MPNDTASDCRDCGGERRHEVLCHDQQAVDEGDGVYWTMYSEMLKCSGCGNVSLRKLYWQGDWPEERNETQVYPPLASRRPPTWKYQLPAEIQRLLTEVHDALDVGCELLPVMGARTIIDVVIRDRVGDQKSFKSGLEALVDAGVLTNGDKDVLHAAVDAASATAHRGFHPAKEDIHAVIDIVEHLLQSVYILGGVANRLKSRTPPRK